MPDIEGRKQQYVYLIQCGSDFYKIGIATNPQERLKQLQTGNPESLKIVKYFSFDNARLVEETLHNAFSAFRSNGEWFKLTNGQVARMLDLCSLLQGGERRSTPRYYLTLDEIYAIVEKQSEKVERLKWKKRLILLPVSFTVLFLVSLILAIGMILNA